MLNFQNQNDNIISVANRDAKEEELSRLFLAVWTKCKLASYVAFVIQDLLRIMNTSEQFSIGESFKSLLDLKTIVRFNIFDQDRSDAVTLPFFAAMSSLLPGCWWIPSTELNTFVTWH